MTDYRKDFRIFDGNDIIYFDNAATSQRPDCVFEAMTKFNDSCNANPLRGLYAWSIAATDAYEDARKKAADFIGAEQASEIIFTRNTSESLNLVASTYAESVLKEGDEIVITVMEHHSNILPWQRAAKRAGAKLVFMEPQPDGKIPEQEFAKIGPKTKIVAAAQVSNVYGVTNEIRKMADLAHKNGAVMVVDGAQSTPHMPVDVKALGADFFAFSGHKMLGPMGIGALYGRQELLEEMPPYMLGGEMIEYVTREDATYAEVPHKFEAGTVNATGAVGLSAAIDYLQGVGFDYIRAQEEKLTALLMEEMAKIPEVTVYGSKDPKEHCGIVTFNIEGCHPHDVSSVLDEEGICIRAGHHCAQPLMQFMGVGSTARASLYFYNTEDEVRRFAEKLAHVRKWLGY